MLTLTGVLNTLSGGRPSLQAAEREQARAAERATTPPGSLLRPSEVKARTDRAAVEPHPTEALMAAARATSGRRGSWFDRI